MTNVAIEIEHLSKQYRIGTAQIRHDTLRDQIVDGAKSAVRRVTGQRSQVDGESEAFWALRDISFTVNKGEVVGVIGHNGAGKSTLLKILSRITRPTAGRGRIAGRVGSLLEVGTGFHPELTGRENITLNGAILGMRKRDIDRKFDEIVAFAEVDRFLDTPVKRYSSGMYVRLAFAVAAHLEPEILLVDEVLAVGDAAFQRKCLGKMSDVARAGRTVLFVSHNMAMIQHLCSRVLFLRQGTVAADGQPRQMIDAYLGEIMAFAQASLSERTDRSGDGGILIVGIETLDGSGKPCPVALSGQQLTLRMHYKAQRPTAFGNSRISLSVHKDEHVYFLLSTELVSRQQLDLEGSGYLDFIVPDLPLSEGNYHLNSFIESNGAVQDWVIGAASLSVVDGDYYGTGRNYPSGWKGRCVLVKHRWSLNGDGA